MTKRKRDNAHNWNSAESQPGVLQRSSVSALPGYPEKMQVTVSSKQCYLIPISFRWIIGQNIGCVIKEREEYTILNTSCSTMLQDKMILLLSVTLIFRQIKEWKENVSLFSTTYCFLKTKGDTLTNCLCVDFLVLHSFLVTDGTGSRYFGPVTGEELRKIFIY